MPKEEKFLTCTKCKKKNLIDAQFCSYCGEKIISTNSWADSLANKLIIAMNDVEGLSIMLKTLGFKDKVTDRMKIEDLIWRMFAVHLIIQEKTKDKEVNDIFHHAVATKLYHSEKEIEQFFNLMRTRYETYYKTITSKSDQMMFNLVMDYLDFFIFGKVGDNKYPIKNKILPISIAVMEDFSSFSNFTRENWFKNQNI